MTKSAKEFLDEWVSQNITPISYDEDDTQAKAAARMCLADAERQGISFANIENAAGGDLVAHMAGEIRKVVDEEVRRLAKEGP